MIFEPHSGILRLKGVRLQPCRSIQIELISLPGPNFNGPCILLISYQMIKKGYILATNRQQLNFLPGKEVKVIFQIGEVPSPPCKQPCQLKAEKLQRGEWNLNLLYIKELSLFHSLSHYSLSHHDENSQFLNKFFVTFIYTKRKDNMITSSTISPVNYASDIFI